MEPKEQRKVDDFIIYAMAAAEQAIDRFRLEADTAEKQERTGVLIGSGIGGLSGIAETVDPAARRRARAASARSSFPAG